MDLYTVHAILKTVSLSRNMASNLTWSIIAHYALVVRCCCTMTVIEYQRGRFSPPGLMHILLCMLQIFPHVYSPVCVNNRLSLSVMARWWAALLLLFCIIQLWTEIRVGWHQASWCPATLRYDYNCQEQLWKMKCWHGCFCFEDPLHKNWILDNCRRPTVSMHEQKSNSVGFPRESNGWLLKWMRCTLTCETMRRALQSGFAVCQISSFLPF